MDCILLVTRLRHHKNFFCLFGSVIRTNAANIARTNPSDVRSHAHWSQGCIQGLAMPTPTRNITLRHFTVWKRSPSSALAFAFCDLSSVSSSIRCPIVEHLQQ